MAKLVKKYKKENNLPEIVITPDKDGVVIKMTQVFPNKNTRDKVLRDYDAWALEELGVSQRDAANRLYDLYKQSGNPNVSTDTSIFMGDREHFNPINNTIYIPDPTFDGYVAELAHAYQFNSGKYSPYKNILKHPLENLKNFTSRNNDTYNRKGSLEYEAHQIIEPKLWNYITK